MDGSHLLLHRESHPFHFGPDSQPRLARNTELRRNPTQQRLRPLCRPVRVLRSAVGLQDEDTRLTLQ